MKITKFGHCCLLIEEGGLRILTDPGNLTTSQNDLQNIDIILVTHEHSDHFHIDSLKEVIKNNPKVKVVTNKAVGSLLDKEGIKFEILEDGQSREEKGIKLEGFGTTHAELHKTLPSVQNTGYMIAEKFFYPGDAFTNPKRNVEILALPVAGPWMKISESVDFALEVKPKLCFPVHDGILTSPGGSHKVPSIILPEKGIKFIILTSENVFDSESY